MDFEIKIIESGYIMVDGGAMFGAIPKRAWKRKYQSDENNLCRLAMRCILAISGDKRILVDLGMGNKHLREASYYQPHGLINIADELNKYGYTKNDITDVVLSHLHFDHCGGATSKNKDGDTLPAFPNATYHVSKSQWQSFLQPNRLEADSFFIENMMPVFEAGQLQLINADALLYDGFELRLFDGHTAGQIVPFINSSGNKIVFAGDVIPTSAHVPLEWISAYDISALVSIHEKERLLNELVSHDCTVIYCHDSTVVSSKIKRLNDNFKADKLLKSDSSFC